MKQLNNYILEKLVLNKNSKSKYDRLETTNTNIHIPIDILVDSIKSIFISIYKNHTYKLKGLSTYVIKRSEIDWNDVIEILNTNYSHNLDPEYANEKNGEFQKIMRLFLGHIENLINMKTVYIRYGDKEIKLIGRDIYFNDWLNYRKNII